MLNDDDGEPLELSGGLKNPLPPTSASAGAQGPTLSSLVSGANGPAAPRRKARIFPSPFASPMIQIATTHSDDPWAGGLDDQLGVADEAKAFARMAVAKAFIPPLAIGLFGDWGSGKSFFMRLVHEHIEKLSAGVAVDAAPEAGSADFHKEVVQIRFNAWHYAETNLWASLVNHLFTELDRWYGEQNPNSPEGLLETLSTARVLTLEAAKDLVARRSDQRNAAKDLLAAKAKLDAARAVLGTSPGVYWEALKLVLAGAAKNSPLATSRDDLKRAAQEIGFTALIDDVDAIQQVSASLASDVERARLLARGLKLQLLGWFPVLLMMLVILLAPLAASYVQALLAQWIPQLGALHQAIVALSLGLSGMTAIVRIWLTKTKKILGRLDAAKGVIDGAVTTCLSEQTQELKVRQDNMSLANAAVEEAQALVKATSERLAQASHNYSQGTGASRLKKFVRARVVDGDYARHLGLIATVRKDFEELSSCVTDDDRLNERVQQERDAFGKRLQQFLDGHKDLLSIEEINELKSALMPSSSDTKDTGGTEVKAFKRIVLYIDDLDRCPPEKVVDVLQVVHLLLTFPIFVVMVAVDVRWARKALQKHYVGLINTGEGAGEGAASANDYLEKIFQIPYWMRPMGDSASESFLADRLRRLEPSPVMAAVEKPAPSVKRLVEVPINKLAIASHEEALLKELAPCIGGSPRRTLRFLNTYRLIKVSLRARELFMLEERGYKALLVQLALATASPRVFEDCAALLNVVSDEYLLNDFVSKVIDDNDDSHDVQQSARIFSIYQRAVYGLAPESAVDLLKTYASIARRYSFTG
ncbi:P-loop NTPase fold protein [Pseudomonas gingeri]|uniref:P-loop NTPase fold protein n=1 Tax=Pseudomonas gingeri TaxID=117681 RepID=UPI0015A26D6F|nr:P-loop NTPase fold protein [Pseudomonas gingeri]NWA05590.1 hypothetical protein [Pseudomonas gingeri]